MQSFVAAILNNCDKNFEAPLLDAFSICDWLIITPLHRLSRQLIVQKCCNYWCIYEYSICSYVVGIPASWYMYMQLEALCTNCMYQYLFRCACLHSVFATTVQSYTRLHVLYCQSFAHVANFSLRSRNIPDNLSSVSRILHSNVFTITEEIWYFGRDKQTILPVRLHVHF